MDRDTLFVVRTNERSSRRSDWHSPSRPPLPVLLETASGGVQKICRQRCWRTARRRKYRDSRKWTPERFRPPVSPAAISKHHARRCGPSDRNSNPSESFPRRASLDHDRSLEPQRRDRGFGFPRELDDFELSAFAAASVFATPLPHPLRSTPCALAKISPRRAHQRCRETPWFRLLGIIDRKPSPPPPRRRVDLDDCPSRRVRAAGRRTTCSRFRDERLTCE